jgi:hypothetical protein
MKEKQLRIIVVGGTGKWAEENYYPAILSLEGEGIDIKVVAIIDLLDPYNPPKGELRTHLSKVLKHHHSKWVQPNVSSPNSLNKQLNDLKSQTDANVIIVSTNPCEHYLYCRWALENMIHVFCDKPLVSERYASSKLSSARKIMIQYEDLLLKYRQAKKINSHYLFATPLRRRALTPFVKTADDLQKVFEKTGEGIRYMHVLLNGGVHKYPQELIKGGAHGHNEGVGTLSHTSYHFIDLIAWYLQIAPGKVAKIKISVPYILRVDDYLKSRSYESLRKIIEKKSTRFNDSMLVPEYIRATELDFQFMLSFYDDKNVCVGNCNFIVDYTAYAPRTVRFDPAIIEYAHDKHGGRMSAAFIDIHQGAFQEIQIIKNDIVSQGHMIRRTRRRHPKLDMGNELMEEKYENAYDVQTINTVEITKAGFNGILGRASHNLAISTPIDSQYLSFMLYADFYELIAEAYETKSLSGTREIHLSKLKKLFAI